MQLTSVDRDTFRQACSRFATGVAVATVSDSDGEPYGLTINSLTSVSCSPPLVLICIDSRSNILSVFRASSFFAINILAENQRDVSVRFAQRQPDRFESVTWMQGTTGAPLLDGCLARFECSINQTIEAGDHTIFIAEVIRTEFSEGRPLVFYGSSYRNLH